MNDDFHSRAREVFLELVDLPAESWEEEIQHRCAGDQALAREVASLLGHFRPMTEVLEPSGPAPIKTQSEMGRTGGTVFAGRYRILARIGRGGMGEVFRAEDQVLGEQVAVKLVQTPGRRGRQSILREVRLARRVTHPNVCRVYDVGEADGISYFTMELVEGEDLRSLLDRIGGLPRPKCWEILRQIVAGLAAAHARGVLHRDLKPANILIGRDGRARITDFGIAEPADGGSKEREDIIGTPAYMAPELFLGQAPTERADLYALALVAIEILTGEPVVEPGPLQPILDFHRHGTPPRLSELIADAPPDLDEVLAQCLVKDPERRPSSVLAVAAAIPGVDPMALAAEAGLTPSPSMIAGLGGRVELGKGFLQGAALALAAVVAVGVFLTDRVLPYRGAMVRTPPDALAERCRTIVGRLGHDFESADHEVGYLPVEWDPGAPESLSFWYRQAERPLVAEGWDMRSRWFRPALEDPPLTEPGMASMILDDAGQLRQFEAMPNLDAPATPTDWNAAFELVGADPAAARPLDAELSTLPSDEWKAWELTDLSTAQSIARLHGAAWRGRVVELGVEFESRAAVAATGADWSPVNSRLFRTSVYRLLPLLGLGVALSYVRRGRASLPTAAKLAGVVAAARLGSALLQHHFVAVPVEEVSAITAIVTAAVAEAVFFALCYLALEPWVRRTWPRALVGWSRALEGRLRDRQVGAELLLGTVMGAIWNLARIGDAWLLGALGWSNAVGADWRPVWAAVRGRFLLANAVGQSQKAIYGAFVALLVYALARLLLRRQIPALVVFALGAAFLDVLQAGHPLLSWLTVGVAVGAGSAFLLVRFGFLALVAAHGVATILECFPTTLDFGLWFAPSGLLGPLIALTLGAAAWTWARQPERTRPRRPRTATSSAVIS